MAVISPPAWVLTPEVWWRRSEPRGLDRGRDNDAQFMRRMRRVFWLGGTLAPGVLIFML